MSTKSQTSKNIDLTQKLLEYLMCSNVLPSLPKDVSFVPFSNSDNELNLANEELLKLLYREEKPVVKAKEPKTKNGDWEIIPINF